MTFTSLFFLLFYSILLICLLITKKERIRQIEILIASAVFYTIWDIRFLVLVLVCIAITHFIVKKMFKIQGSREKRKRKRILAIGITAQLSILCVFKYLKFFIAGFVKLLDINDMGMLNIILPVGISFYIFSAIGYIADVYRKEIDTQPLFYQEAFYILFFPKLLQGPLHKSADFFKQLRNEHLITSQNLKIGIQIFLSGLIKKIVIADWLGLFVDNVYANPIAYSGGTLLLAAVTYPIQLYCDFSGYSDMAVATAKMMGYDLCQNFNLPFLSKNVAEYWRRWHMSLNIWFRDYLFYPIIRSDGINEVRKKTRKKSKKLAKIIAPIVGIVIVWPLVGLWHGASVNFLLYGCLYGLLMIIGLMGDTYGKEKNVKYDFLRIIRTWIITIFAMILFRAGDLGTAAMVLKGILTWQMGISYIYTWSLIFIPIVLSAHFYAYKKNDKNGFYIQMDLGILRNKIILCSVVLFTIILMYVGENYFMYFQF